MPGVRTAAEVAADEVCVHGLKVRWRDGPARAHERAKARGEGLDAGVDPIGEGLGARPPAARERRRDPGVGPQRVAASGRAGGIGEALLTDHEVGILGQVAAADLGGEAAQVVEAVAGVDDRALAGLGDRPRHRPRERPVELEGAPAAGEASHLADHSPGEVLAIDQLEEQARDVGVGEHGLVRRDLLGSVGRLRAHASGAAPLDEDLVDARAEPDHAAVAAQQLDERGGHLPGAAPRDAVAAGGRGQAEHVPKASSKPVVGADVDVQREPGEHPPRRLAAKQPAREAGAARHQDPGDAQQIEGQEAQERAHGRQRAQQERQQVALDRPVPGCESAPRVAVAGVAHQPRRDVVVAANASERAVGRRVAALELHVQPGEAGALEVEVLKRRARPREREERGADVVHVAGQRALLRAERPAGAGLVGLEHEHAGAGAGEHAGRDEAVGAGAYDDEVRVPCAHLVGAS